MTTADDDKPATEVETWRYAGFRLPEGGKPYSAWQDPSGRLLGYSTKGDSARTPGSYYAVKVSRADGTVVRYGEPKYLRHENDDAAAGWAVEEHEAKQRQARAAMERKAQPPIDEAIRPLMRIAAGLRTQAQRDALTAYVIGELRRAHVFHPDDFADWADHTRTRRS